MKKITASIPDILYSQLERIVNTGNMNIDDALTITIMQAMFTIEPSMKNIMIQDSELNYYAKLLRLDT